MDEVKKQAMERRYKWADRYMWRLLIWVSRPILKRVGTGDANAAKYWSMDVCRSLMYWQVVSSGYRGAAMRRKALEQMGYPTKTQRAIREVAKC